MPANQTYLCVHTTCFHYIKYSEVVLRINKVLGENYLFCIVSLHDTALNVLLKW